MTTLYIRGSADGALQGHHWGVTAGSTTRWYGSRANAAHEAYVTADVYLLEEGTETTLATAIAQTSTTYRSTTGSDTLTGTWTPSSTSISKSGNMRIMPKIHTSGGSSGFGMYTGPIFATNLNAVQWTFHHELYFDADVSYLRGNNSNHYVEGLSFSGSPSSAHFILTNAIGNNYDFDIITTNHQGSWGNESDNVVCLMAYRIGAATYSSFTSASADTSYLRRSFVSFPCVLDGIAPASGTISFIEGLYQDTAAYDGYGRYHLWVTQGESDTLRGTIVSNFQDSSAMPIGTPNGRDLSTTGSEVEISAGDCIVLEVGWYVNFGGGTGSGRHYYGGVNSNLLTDGGSYDDPETYPGWIEIDIESPTVQADATISGSGSLTASATVIGVFTDTLTATQVSDDIQVGWAP